MDIQKAFGKSLQMTRKARNLSQEDFSDVSSRTYISSLERGLKSPTLEKVQALAERMDVHPLTLLAIAYLRERSGTDLKDLLGRVKNEVEGVVKAL